VQNLRGGRVKLQSIMMPEMEFSHPEKGEAGCALGQVIPLVGGVVLGVGVRECAFVFVHVCIGAGMTWRDPLA